MERKSAVVLRSEAATSAGAESTYGPPVSATAMAAATSAGLAPSPAMTSTRLTVSSWKIRCIVRSGRITVRPPDPMIGPPPATIPTTVRSIGASPAWKVIVPPTIEPLAVARVWVIRA